MCLTDELSIKNVSATCTPANDKQGLCHAETKTHAPLFISQTVRSREGGRFTLLIKFADFDNDKIFFVCRPVPGLTVGRNRIGISRALRGVPQSNREHIHDNPRTVELNSERPTTICHRNRRTLRQHSVNPATHQNKRSVSGCDEGAPSNQGEPKTIRKRQGKRVLGVRSRIRQVRHKGVPSSKSNKYRFVGSVKLSIVVRAAGIGKDILHGSLALNETRRGRVNCGQQIY